MKVKLKKIYTPEEVLIGGTSYNHNFDNPNYKLFVESCNELYIIIELEDHPNYNGYCASVVSSNFYEFDKIYFAIDMLRPENRFRSKWNDVK
jgi:hypothetical protein